VSTKLEEFEKSVYRLEEALNQEKNDFIRDSVIQRFKLIHVLPSKKKKCVACEKDSRVWEKTLVDDVMHGEGQNRVGVFIEGEILNV
jgi:hypothetical protein